MLSKRELESRYEVFTEQYAVNINIESETAAAIARTMLLPAAVRYLNELKATGLDELSARSSRSSRSCTSRIVKLEDANLSENQPDELARRSGRSTCATP